MGNLMFKIELSNTERSIDPQRKSMPVATGVLDYFPEAILEVAHLSWAGSQHHNPGEPTNWCRSKSSDEPDALMRHFMQRGKIDSDGIRHSTKVAWRALAMLQKEIEASMTQAEIEARGLG